MAIQKSDYKIYIIGAGISGLIAATVLEKNGYKPVLIESTDRVGGRVKTDFLNDTPLDFGFQVLLTAYPMAKKYLDMDALQLAFFEPGAMIIKDGKKDVIGDPLRNFSFALPTLTSTIGTVGDKIKILKLQQRLKKKTLNQIFESPEVTTVEYLRDLGFSEKIIQAFFVPFFSGIFLESTLGTSSRMFEFVYKMFGEGSAAIPKRGIEAIPIQLKSRLKRSEFLFNTTVKSVEDGCLILEDDSEIPSDLTIIATDANSLVPNLRHQEFRWKGCETLYFEVIQPASKFKVIQLVADEEAQINSVFSLTDLFNLKSDNHIISVTLVKEHNVSQDILIEKVAKELERYFGMSHVKFLKRYSVRKALPHLENIQNFISPEETRLTSRTFLAGDTLLNGSLNGAMQAGELAAMGVINLLEESQDLAQFTSEYL
ncbi:MAG: FAD-dependent oxidoreductase [Bacteroidota bacterium]